MLSQNFSPASSRSGTPVSIPSSKISSPARSRTSSAHVNLEMLSTHGSPRHQRVRQLSGQTELMHSPMHSPQPIRYLEDSLSVAVPADTLNRRLENFLAEQELKRKHSPEVPSPLRAEPNKRSRGESKPNLIQKKEIIANIRQHLAKLHNKGSIAVTQPANDFQKAHQQQVTLLQQQFPASFNNHNWKHGDQLNDNINQLLTDFTFNLSDSDSRYTAAAFGTKSPLKHYLSYHSRPGFESAGLEPLLIELSFYFCHLAALPSDQREPFLIDFPNTAFPVNEILDENDFNLVTETCVPGTYNRLSEATYKLRCLIIPGFKDNNYYSAAQDFIQKQIASLDLIEKLSNPMLEVHLPPALLLSQGIPENELHDIYAKLTLSEIHAHDIYKFNQNFTTGVIQEKIKLDIAEVGRTYSPSQEHQQPLATVVNNIRQTTGYSLWNNISNNSLDKGAIFPYFVNEEYENSHFNENHFNQDIEQLIQQSPLTAQHLLLPDYNTLISHETACEKMLQGLVSNNHEIFRESVDALHAIGGPFKSSSPALFGYLQRTLPDNKLAHLAQKSRKWNMPEITTKINQLIIQYKQYQKDHHRYLILSRQRDLNIQNILFNYLITIGNAPLWLIEKLTPMENFNEFFLHLSDETRKSLIMRPDVIQKYGEVLHVSDQDVCEMVFDAIINKQDQTIDTLKSIFKTLNLDMPLNDDKQTPLHIAACQNDVDAIEQLLQLGASAYCIDIDQSTPMMLAIENSSYDALKILCEKCPDLIEIDNGHIGITPIRNAAYLEDQRAMNILIEHNAKLNPINEDGETPLFYLLQEFNFPSIIENESESDFEKSIQEEKADLMGLINTLINAGADVSHVNFQNKTPVHYAIDTGDSILLEKLLQAGTFKPNPPADCIPYGSFAINQCRRPELLPLLKTYGVEI